MAGIQELGTASDGAPSVRGVKWEVFPMLTGSALRQALDDLSIPTNERDPGRTSFIYAGVLLAMQELSERGETPSHYGGPRKLSNREIAEHLLYAANISTDQDLASELKSLSVFVAGFVRERKRSKK